MKTFHHEPRLRKSKGFTLIELMLATGMGLALLLGLVKIISMVNATFADTRVLIDLQNRCRTAQMLLQQDLSHISVTPQPPRPIQMDDGYLCLGTLTNTTTKTSNNGRSLSEMVDVRDGNLSEVTNEKVKTFAAFTVFNRENPFSFPDPSNRNRTLQTPYAEVVWFVYQNDLYRVTLPFVTASSEPESYSSGTGSNSLTPSVRRITPGMLGDLDKRMMDNILSNVSSDYLKKFMVLPNVIMFDVEVYDPSDEQKNYVSVREMNDRSYYKKENSSSSSSSSNSFTIRYDTGSTLALADASKTSDASADSSDEYVYVNDDIYQKNSSDVPTMAFLPGMRIIVRAFDPDSGSVREFRVGQDFRTR